MTQPLKNILCIEDEPYILTVMKMSLEAGGFEATLYAHRN
jgi:CheY-like chemotaxis protein